MFYGIIIRMYNNGEHNPPHFHAPYQGYNAIADNERIQQGGYSNAGGHETLPNGGKPVFCWYL